MSLARKIKNKSINYLSFFREFLNNIFYGKNKKDFHKFVILCNGRSGSNMLVSFLNSHPNIKCFSEIFHQHAPRFGFPYQTFLSEEKLKALRKKSISDFLYKYIFKGTSPRIQAVGFKLIYWHCEGNDWEANIIPTLESIENLKIIHLTRKNKLDQFISGKIAHENKKWVARQSSEVIPLNSLNIDPKECVEKILENISLEVKYSKRFAESKIIHVSYEDILTQENQTLSSIQSFLGVTNKQLKTRTIRQIQKPKNQFVDNYSELKLYFQNTDFTQYFDE